MNKKIIIGIVILIVIGISVVSLAYVNQNNEKRVTNVSNSQRIPQHFTVGLSESIGFKEKP